MSLPLYQKLKDSGIDYLGTVPSDWPLKRLGDIVAFAQGKAHEPYIDDDGDYICVNSRFVSTAGKTTKNCSVNLTPASLHDILMVMSDLPNGRALARAYYVYDNGKYAVNQRVCRITAVKARSRFLFYLLDRHPGLMQNDDGVNQTHLSNDDFQKLKFYLPSFSEQTQIARFLDHETARIDTLIEEQQRLMELLKEKRQAVISHAVTKGLDPTVSMKDSGVAWIGGVPAHWDIAPLKHVVSIPITDGPHETPEFIDEGVLFVSAEAVSSGRVDFEKARYISHADHSKYSKKYKPQKYDIYMVKSGATTGVTAIVETDHDFNIWSPLAAIRCRQQYDPYFVLYCMRSRSFQESVVLNWSYGTQQNIGMGVIESLPITSPPLSEQKLISCFISEQMTRWNGLIETAVNTVTLLQERRSALISAAVTGKIDVRGWQPSASVSSPVLEEEAV